MAIEVCRFVDEIFQAKGVDKTIVDIPFRGTYSSTKPGGGWEKVILLGNLGK